MLRLMVEHARAAPKGWCAYASAQEFLSALADADLGEVAAVAIRGTVEECTKILEAVGNAANQQFHLLGGFVTLERIHFHDPDAVHAKACMERALNHHKDHTLPSVDTHVPIGERAIWNRDEEGLILPGTAVPETVKVEMIGMPVSRLVASPLLPAGMLVTGFIDHPTDLVITISAPETTE